MIKTVYNREETLEILDIAIKDSSHPEEIEAFSSIKVFVLECREDRLFEITLSEGNHFNLSLKEDTSTKEDKNNA